MKHQTKLQFPVSMGGWNMKYALGFSTFHILYPMFEAQIYVIVYAISYAASFSIPRLNFRNSKETQRKYKEKIVACTFQLKGEQKNILISEILFSQFDSL